jgi:hypothetical protein
MIVGMFEIQQEWMYIFKVEMSTCTFDRRNLTFCTTHNIGGQQWKLIFSRKKMR